MYFVSTKTCLVTERVWDKAGTTCIAADAIVAAAESICNGVAPTIYFSAPPTVAFLVDLGVFRPVRSLLLTSRTTRGDNRTLYRSMNAPTDFGSRLARARNAQDIAFTIMSS